MSVRERPAFITFTLRLIREKPLGAFGGAIFVLFLFFGLFADFLIPYGVNETDLRVRLEGPSADHLFGTDHLGRDVLSRVLIGAQLSMTIGFLAAGFATVISIILGVLSGYFGGKVDMLIQRFVDAWMCFPDLLFLMVVISIIGAGVPQIVMALSLIYGIAGSRIVRGSVISVRENMHTHAARSMGAKTMHILVRHILPNITGPILVTATFRIPAAILTESTLSFIGLGIQPPFSSWGVLASDGFAAMRSYPHLILFPGLAILVTLLGFHMLGDSLREALDPRVARERGRG